MSTGRRGESRARPTHIGGGTWHSRDLGDALTAHVELAAIEAAVAAAWNKGSSPGVAAYTRHQSEGRLHCAVVVYFTPAAAGLAKRFGATACRTPAMQDLAWLAGEPAT